MGIFDKLFDKKNCAICGAEIGLLGNRKLADGNLCKDCAKLLSPLMTDRRQCTVEEIRQHLDYRERNKQVLLGVTPTKVYGHRSRKIYVDENKAQFFIADDRNYIPTNPDIISVSQVIGFQPSVHESRTELYHHDREGRRVPYNPPRYQYEYRFDVSIQVNAPFFDEIRFEFSSDRPDSPRSSLYQALESEIVELQDRLTPANYASFAPTAMTSIAPTQTSPMNTSGNTWTCSCGQVNSGKFCTNCGLPPAASNPAPVADGWTCTACGQVNQGKFCTNCGTKKPAVFRCDKCGWQPEDPNKLPKFCPNCGDPFNEADVE